MLNANDKAQEKFLETLIQSVQKCFTSYMFGFPQIHINIIVVKIEPF